MRGFQSRILCPRRSALGAAAPKVAAALAGLGPSSARPWIDALQGVQEALAGPLSRIARDPACDVKQRHWATNLLAGCTPVRPELLTPVLIEGDDEQFAMVFPPLARLDPPPLRLLEMQLEIPAGDDPADPRNELLARRKARAAVALLRLDHPEKVWPLFKHAADEGTRSYLIHWSRLLGVDDPQAVIRHLAIEKDASIRSGLLLLLGEFPDAGRPEDQRQGLVEQLLAIFAQEPDPGLHAAAEWLLRKWKCDDAMKAAIKRLGKNEAPRRPTAPMASNDGTSIDKARHL